MLKRVSFITVPVVALLLMVLWVQGVFAHGTMDEANEGQVVGDPLLATISLNMPIAQEFTPSRPKLKSVDVYLTTVNLQFQLGDGENITVNIWEGSIGSVLKGSSSQVVPNFDNKGILIDGFVLFEFQPNIDVVPGDVYVLEVVAPPFASPPDGSAAGTHAISLSPADNYAGGNPIIEGVKFRDRDFWFRTYGSGQPG